MKLLYKVNLAGYLTAFFVAITFNVYAQFPLLQHGKDSFIHFTSVKTYSDITKLNEVTPAKYRNHPDFGKCFNDSIRWIEQIDKRTLKTRSYIGNNGEMIRQFGYGNINYIDANGWVRAVNTNLSPSQDGWSALQQELPVFIYHDASSAITLGHNQLMIFNKNVQFNSSSIAANNFTVGDNGMYIADAVAGVDKTIKCGRGRVETDYIIKNKITTSNDLVISEDVILPPGYVINESINEGNLTVISPDGKKAAELKKPFCFDKSKQFSFGSYQIQKQSFGYRLNVVVSSQWLNDNARNYPVTIDPVVTGNLSYWTGDTIGSCFDSLLEQRANDMDTGSISITIPGGITLTNFIVYGSFTSNIFTANHGAIWMWTSCGDSLFAVDSADTQTGIVYLGSQQSAGDDFLTYVPSFLCCYKPSCSDQSFRLTMALIRNDSASGGCNANTLFYDPANDGGPYGFGAYVIGHTVEATYTDPPNICADNCSLNMQINVNYGVPPYKIIHPWSADTVSVGRYSDTSCTSNAKINLVLTVPNCPGQQCVTSFLTTPPPKIIDACGDTVAGLAARSIPVKAAPDVSATPDTQIICSGTNVNIALGSCLSGTTFSWTSSQGATGAATPINNVANNNGSNNIVVDFTVTPMGSDGCAGLPTIFPVTVTPFTITAVPSNAAICDGSSVNITTTGEATVYAWSPADGLSCTTCSNLTANPTVTTTYIVSGTNGGACSAVDTVVVVVNPNPTLSVSNDTTINSGKSVRLLATTSDSITWSPSEGLSCTDCSNPLATPSATTTYKATATLGSCTVSADVTIRIIQPCDVLKVPSGFTPNGDGINDYLHILGFGQVDLQTFKIYNRWGQLMYQTADINDKGWDGSYNGKPQSVGTYVYYAEINCEGKTVTLKGDVTLIR